MCWATLHMVEVASVCQVAMTQWLMCGQNHYREPGGHWFNSPWVLYILAFWLVIFTKSKTKCTPTVLPEHSQGLPLIGWMKNSQCSPCFPETLMGVSGSFMGISWESHWTPSGISATKYGTPSIVPGDSHLSSSRVPETLLGISRESLGSPRGFPGYWWVSVTYS